MRRTLTMAILASSLMMASAGVASAQGGAADRASCIGIFSSHLAHDGSTLTRSDMAHLFVEGHKLGDPPPGKDTSTYAKFHGSQEDGC